MKITKRKLQSMGACAEHVALFAKTFPRGTYVTLESLAKAREVGLDVHWFAGHVPDDRRDEYERIEQPAWDEYKRITRPALAEFERVAQSALAEFERTAQPSWDEYKRIAQSAWDEYERIRQSAWAEYEKARDTALVVAFAD